MRRGEIWWVTFPAPVGRRPAILVSRNEAYAVRASVTVVPLTRTIRSIPVEVAMGPSDGVPHRSVASADSITTIPKRLVADYLGTLSPAKLKAVDRAIAFALDLP